MLQATFAGVKNLLIGMGVTFRNMLSKPVTLQYPEVKRTMPTRYRGRHFLNRDEDGLERCVGVVYVPSIARWVVFMLLVPRMIRKIRFLKESGMRRFMRSISCAVFIVDIAKRPVRLMRWCFGNTMNSLITTGITTSWRSKICSFTRSPINFESIFWGIQNV